MASGLSKSSAVVSASTPRNSNGATKMDVTASTTSLAHRNALRTLAVFLITCLKVARLRIAASAAEHVLRQKAPTSDTCGSSSFQRISLKKREGSGNSEVTEEWL